MGCCSLRRNAVRRRIDIPFSRIRSQLAEQVKSAPSNTSTSRSTKALFISRSVFAFDAMRLLRKMDLIENFLIVQAEDGQIRHAVVFRRSPNLHSAVDDDIDSGDV